MKAIDLAGLLRNTPNADVLVKVGNDWVEVVGVIQTGQHRNAVTFNVIEPNVGGVVIVDEEMTPLNQTQGQP